MKMYQHLNTKYQNLKKNVLIILENKLRLSFMVKSVTQGVCIHNFVLLCISCCMIWMKIKFPLTLTLNVRCYPPPEPRSHVDHNRYLG